MQEKLIPLRLYPCWKPEGEFDDEVTGSHQSYLGGWRSEGSIEGSQTSSILDSSLGIDDLERQKVPDNAICRVEADRLLIENPEAFRSEVDISKEFELKLRLTGFLVFPPSAPLAIARENRVDIQDGQEEDIDKTKWSLGFAMICEVRHEKTGGTKMEITVDSERLEIPNTTDGHSQKEGEQRIGNGDPMTACWLDTELIRLDIQRKLKDELERWI